VAKNEGGKMKNYRKELWFEVPTRRAFINITPQVDKCLQESGIKEGFVLVNTKHIKFTQMRSRF
jgi:thiamine phosphate synthase YjbQ (UPF0047 family)